RQRQVPHVVAPMLAAAKPKKRSRLALPRQKGARSAPNVGVLRATSQQETQAAVGSNGAGCNSSNSAAPSGVISDATHVPSTRSTAAASLSNENTIQTAPRATAVTTAAVRATSRGSLPRARQDLPDESARPYAGRVADREQRDLPDHQHVACAARSPARNRHERAGCCGNARDSVRGPLQTVEWNTRRETTAVADDGRKQDDDTAAAADAAAAVVAAAASEVHRMLDGLQNGDENNRDFGSGGDAAEPARETPPPTPQNSEGRHLQRKGSKQCRKRPRSGSVAVPSALPSPTRPPPPPPFSSRAPAPATPERAQHRGDATRLQSTPETASAAEVDLRDSDCEVERKSGDDAEGGGGGGGGTGEKDAAEKRPLRLTPAKKSDGAPSSSLQASPGKRERCPVCGCAVWGLSVRARQVHINSCLDGTTVLNGGEGGGGGVSDRDVVVATAVRAAPLGQRSSTATAREPKTEYQAHIQMAKALSKSLVVPRTPAAVDAPDRETDEELLRNPAAFRAKEKRLLGVLKGIDAKLERLQKDRDIALKRLAAHRALSPRVSVVAEPPSEDPGGDGGGGGGGPLKTADEVVNMMFPDEHTGGGGSPPVPAHRPATREEGRRWREQQKAAPVNAVGDGAVADVAGADAAGMSEGTPASTRPRSSRVGGSYPAAEEVAGREAEDPAVGEGVTAAADDDNDDNSDDDDDDDRDGSCARPPSGDHRGCGDTNGGGVAESGEDKGSDAEGSQEEARLIRRRSSGGGAGVRGDSGQPLATVGG
ncbi:unnamed protein product, partial [Scytosiphon promiscuus]